jgi:uncharacterized surface protein with fasciclin (FAS1) repeats
MKSLCTAFALLGFLVVASSSAYAANSRLEAELAGRGNLSMFYQALLNTGVANELREDMEYSVFAPTNAAFNELNPRAYPCFYTSQCRAEVAALLRNHIVPMRNSLRGFAGGEISTIGNKRLYVTEAYRDTFTVNGKRVAYRDDLSGIFQIDGVIADPQELTAFARQPSAPAPEVGAERTVTTSRTIVVPPETGGYMVPGGFSSGSPIYWPPDQPNPAADSTTVIVH